MLLGMTGATPDYGERLMAEGGQLSLLELALFNLHISEFAGFEDFAALETFDKFGVFFASHNLYTRVLALCHCAAHSGGSRRLDGIIDSGFAFVRPIGANDMPELPVFLAGSARAVKQEMRS